MRIATRFLATLGLFAGRAFADRGDPEVTAMLDPVEIRLGQDADLSVTISARQRPDPVSLPGVDGLDFENTGQSSSYRVVNGVVSGSTTFHVRVTAQRTGTFTIPAIEVTAGGRSGRSEPLDLKVVARAARRTPPASARVEAGTAGDPAFLVVTPAKKDLYVGERIPVEIRACFRAGQQASIRSLPQLKGSAFTLETPDKEPVRAELMIEGEPYVALSWEGALSAVKEGDHPFEASLDATLVLPFDRAHPRRPRVSADPFADSFFDSAFDSIFERGREEEVTLRGEPLTFHVKPLPAEGRPEGFAGGVGSFRLGASASPTAVAAGEPITLTATVEGSGNFARVTAPSFPATPGWKAYPAKGTFEPADSSGAAGRKTFAQAVTPGGGDVKEIPPLSFSYFDPERAEYVTLRTEPIPVEVSGAAVPAVREPAVSAAAPEAPALSQSGVRSLRPAWESGWFRYGGIGLLATAVAAFVAMRARARGPRPTSLRALRAEAMRAIAESDARAFFAAFRGALQERLAPCWGCAPGSITLAELRRRGAEAEMQAFFETADAVAYSGLAASQEEMEHWQRRLLAAIENMEKRR
ncbi:MAG: BatD family protein [Planctomycetota bacterium]